MPGSRLLRAAGLPVVLKRPLPPSSFSSLPPPFSSFPLSIPHSPSLPFLSEPLRCKELIITFQLSRRVSWTHLPR